MEKILVVDDEEKIRAIKDFPKEGIIFRDITTALKDADVMKNMIDFLYELTPEVQALIAGMFTFIITSFGAASVFLFKKFKDLTSVKSFYYAK